MGGVAKATPPPRAREGRARGPEADPRRHHAPASSCLARYSPRATDSRSRCATARVAREDGQSSCGAPDDEAAAGLDRFVAATRCASATRRAARPRLRLASGECRAKPRRPSCRFGECLCTRAGSLGGGRAAVREARCPGGQGGQMCDSRPVALGRERNRLVLRSSRSAPRCAGPRGSESPTRPGPGASAALGPADPSRSAQHVVGAEHRCSSETRWIAGNSNDGGARIWGPVAVGAVESGATRESTPEDARDEQVCVQSDA